jgi:hypothetical protein
MTLMDMTPEDDADMARELNVTSHNRLSKDRAKVAHLRVDKRNGYQRVNHARRCVAC